MPTVTELLARARQSAAAAVASTSKQTLDSEDGLAGQDEIIRFTADDDDDTATAEKQRKKRKKRSAVESIEPAAIRAPPTSLTLGQDLAASLLDHDHDDGNGASKWNKLPMSKSSISSRMRKERKRTAGKHWFDMPAGELTKETKRELQALRLMNTLDPKSFMKSSSKEDKAFPEYFQIGYVVDSDQRATTGRQGEDASIRRKKSFVEQLVEDEKARTYLKRKTDEVRAKGMSGKQKHKKARLRSRS